MRFDFKIENLRLRDLERITYQFKIYKLKEKQKCAAKLPNILQTFKTFDRVPNCFCKSVWNIPHVCNVNYICFLG